MRIFCLMWQNWESKSGGYCREWFLDSTNFLFQNQVEIKPSIELVFLLLSTFFHYLQHRYGVDSIGICLMDISRALLEGKTRGELKTKS